MDIARILEEITVTPITLDSVMTRATLAAFLTRTEKLRSASEVDIDVQFLTSLRPRRFEFGICDLPWSVQIQNSTKDDNVGIRGDTRYESFVEGASEETPAVKGVPGLVCRGTSLYFSVKERVMNFQPIEA